MFDWKRIIFALAVCLLFVPMVYLGVNTFYPEVEDNCGTLYSKPYRYYSTPEFATDNCYSLDNTTKRDECLEQQMEREREIQECYKTYEKERTKNDGGKFITIMIICLIASFVILVRKLDKSIIYGLFFGIVITAFSGTMTYMNAKSLIGFILLVVLFIIMILFIQKEKNKN